MNNETGKVQLRHPVMELIPESIGEEALEKHFQSSIDRQMHMLAEQMKLNTTKLTDTDTGVLSDGTG